MTTELRSAVLGARELVSFIAMDAATGTKGHPLGSSPLGLLVYTAGGHMSAQLADSNIAYGGRGNVQTAR